jgi:hypothetical protein
MQLLHCRWYTCEVQPAALLREGDTFAAAAAAAVVLLHLVQVCVPQSAVAAKQHGSIRGTTGHAQTAEVRARTALATS